MKPEQQQRLRAKRQAKSDWLREARSVCNRRSANAMLKRIADTNYGILERPQPETLGDYVSVERFEHGLRCAYYDEYGESWRKVWLLDGTLDDYDIEHITGAYEYYRGPGQAFAHRPWVQHNGHSTLVVQTGGLDI